MPAAIACTTTPSRASATDTARAPAPTVASRTTSSKAAYGSPTPVAEVDEVDGVDELDGVDVAGAGVDVLGADVVEVATAVVDAAVVLVARAPVVVVGGRVVVVEVAADAGAVEVGVAAAVEGTRDAVEPTAPLPQAVINSAAPNTTNLRMRMIVSEPEPLGPARRRVKRRSRSLPELSMTFRADLYEVS
ncbi:MAG: hypothetical protein WAS51_13170 [Ilumatobacteraceae bacterium]